MNAPLSADERARLFAVMREAGRPLNHRLRFINADGSRNEAEIARAIERRLAHHRHAERDRPGCFDADLWFLDAIATVEAEVGGELAIWNVRAGHVEPLICDPLDLCDSFEQQAYDRDRANERNAGL